MCGPLLYLLYMNDISKVQNRCNVSPYADDMVLYLSGNKLDDVIASIQEDLVNMV